MTSKHCFFKMMREDFRHKIWMLALSVLGNMLAIPVIYLISVDHRDGMLSVRNMTNQAGMIAAFFSYTVVISGGIVAIAGAVIVGLSGFRYVFHRNMVDTYHSIPVRRSTLFWVNWLNGFLIWFVPALISLGFTLLLGLGKLGSLKGRLTGMVMNEEERILVSYWVTGGRLAASALVSLLALTVAFLLVYHLVLLAVMLCGNVLNAMVTGATLGVGVISVYSLFIAFCTMYFDTFVSSAVNGHKGLVYASPLVSSIILLYRRVSMAPGGEFSFWCACILNLAIALALGALSFLAYLKRPSELAEQGLRIRPVRFLVQITVSLAAAMGGWLLFYIVGDDRLIWGVFGAVLAGVVSFGVMDIVFHMDFKTFFAHKVLMGLTVAAGVFAGLLFYYDWLGYDGYLPDREDIAEIAVYDHYRNNAYGYYYYDVQDAGHPLHDVHIRDSAAAYAFLESMTRPGSGETEEDMLYGGGEEILAKVTLNSGRTYYRSYYVFHGSSDAACTLLTSAEYLDANYRIAPEEGWKCRRISLQRDVYSSELQMDTPEGAELFGAICEAYNRDLEENPEAFIRGDGRLLCGIRMYSENYGTLRYLEVFEGMEHTREALRQHGFAQFADPLAPEDIEEIQLSLGYRYAEDGTEWDPVEDARDVYGVRRAEDGAGVSAEEAESETYDAVYGAETATATDYGVYSDYAGEVLMLHITDKDEIRELLELISYDEGRYYNGGAFRLNKVDRVTLVLSEDGDRINVNIPYGSLPEKYILRFGTLQSEGAQTAE